MKSVWPQKECAEIVVLNSKFLEKNKKLLLYLDNHKEILKARGLLGIMHPERGEVFCSYNERNTLFLPEYGSCLKMFIISHHAAGYLSHE